jgi:DNA replication ATP-dependent helicase Dna2
MLKGAVFSIETKIGSGLLYYTQTDSMLEVNAAKPEIRGLLSARNELAGYLARKRIVQEKQRIRSVQKANGKSSSFAQPSFVSQATQVATQASGSAVPFDIEDIGILPPTVENARECRSCYASDSCMLYRKVSGLKRS